MTAAVMGGALATGLFLWSRRGALAERLESLTGRDGNQAEDALSSADDGRFDTQSASSAPQDQRSGRSQAEIAEEALTLKEIGKADGAHSASS